MALSTAFRLPACAVALVAAWCCALPLAASAAPDVRILIDVSGSMKQNDPANLRVPAMRLITELLPAGTEAGIWLFAEQVEALVEPGKVDDRWREVARKQLPKIHSRGLFTHIEQGIDAASAGWTAGDGHPARHIVLLTDGMVDVSKQPGASAASRQRILSGQIEQLKSLGAQVHAIALSDNVDQELMETLTTETGGWLERADDAGTLQRIFLHMLEQTAAPVTVPLEGDHFDIDDSVSELTLLIFRKEGVAVMVTPPGGATLLADQHPAGVSWHMESGYELITIDAPAAGTWHFEGALDPDNRAVIVTDLALELAPVSSSLLASEAVGLAARLTAGGKTLNRLELLDLVKASSSLGAAAQPGGAITGALTLNRETATFEGRIESRGLAPGVYDLAVTLDGGTFKRQVNKHIRVAADPVTISYQQEHGETGAVVIEATPDPELTVPGSLSGFVTVSDGQDLVRAYPLGAPEQGVTRLRIPASMAGAHRFAPRLYLTTRDQRVLQLEPTPQTFDLAHAAAPETQASPAPAVAPFSWPRLVAIVGVANALLALGLGTLWWFMGHRRASPPPAAQPA